VKLSLSRLCKSATITTFRIKHNIIANTIDKRIISIERAKSGDSVCHGREGHSHYFFYMYSALISNLQVCLPFYDSTMGVLRVLNVEPSHLYPNSWASLQAFLLICRVFHLKFFPQVFLRYYCTRLGELVSWLSLVSQSHQCLLTSYTQSFKNFKIEFFKVVIRSVEAEYFYFDNGAPKFPSIGLKISPHTKFGRESPSPRKICFCYPIWTKCHRNSPPRKLLKCLGPLIRAMIFLVCAFD